MIVAMLAPLLARSAPADAAAPANGAAPAAASAATPTFDWWMPDRFGPDRNGDGLIDYVDGASDYVTSYSATPSSWHVNLTACAIPVTGPAIYHWVVLDQPNPAASPITVQGGPGCAAFFMDVPEEGTYRVQLVTETNGVMGAPIVRPVVVQDWLIVSLGDSYGSGEGAPDIPIQFGEWTEAQQAWQNYDNAVQRLTTVQASTDALNAAIGRWQAATQQAAYYCDPTRHDADPVICAQALGSIAVESAFVVGQLVAFGVTVAIETVGDAINALAALVNGLVQQVQALLQTLDAITGQLSATWESARCHRSANSGSAQAALSLEQSDPHTSVTFVHLACSGATVTYGLLGYYQGTEHPEDVSNVACAQADRPAACIPPQVEVAKQLIGSREVDATYVSIGGNDAHFADIVTSCIVQDNCTDPVSSGGQDMATAICPPLGLVPAVGGVLGIICETQLNQLALSLPTAPVLLNEGINGDTTDPVDPTYPGLANAYASLDASLLGANGWVPSGREGRVFLSQYVDAIKRDDGALCDVSMGADSLPGLANFESGYIDTTIIPALFGAIQQATTTHGWTYVDGIYNGFTNHGYCANDHYMVRAQETFINEGRYQGLVHPNAKGYAVYAANILSKWRAQMYPNGLSGEPRRPDQRPYADAGTNVTVAEGSTATLTASAFDSNGDPTTIAWSQDRPGKVTITPANSATPTLAGLDDTTGTGTLTVSDASGGRSDTMSFTVTNVAPTISAVSGLDSPVAVGGSARGVATFADRGTSDTHTATFAWGDGSSSNATIIESLGTGTATAGHAYAAPGLYQVTITVTDDDGGSVSYVHDYVVVFDASGGFANGGGWFNSPAGAYTPNDPSDPDVTGVARFAFVSKYNKGATVPTGNAAFRFQAGDLDFESTAYDWLVVSGTKATFRGTGTLNGAAGYRFTITANDGTTKSGGVDQLRVRIWQTASGTLVYDNQAGAADDAAPTTAIGGGQINVQK